jgi:hypothetical protein
VACRGDWDIKHHQDLLRGKAGGSSPKELEMEIISDRGKASEKL